MAVVYLEPEDLTAAQRAGLLEFLNMPKTAGELAQRVEFPGEPDIGLQLAERILAARRAAGGQFSSVKQVADVPLIGPERFTELCLAALGADIRRWLGNAAALAGEQPALASELGELRRKLAELRSAAPCLEIELTDNGQAFLGQAIDARVRLRDEAGDPLINQRLTLETSLGSLTHAFGLNRQRGPVLSVVTSADGSARFSLEHEPLEPLTVDQQNALKDALTLLDPSASTPSAARETFLILAERYQGDREEHLRTALDIYARHFKANFFDQQNPSNWAFEWPTLSAVLRVHYHPATGAGVLASAVRPVIYKNWVAAWFEFLAEFLANRTGLERAFSAAKRRGAEGARLAEDLVGEAHTFVAEQRGLAAEWASQRAVKFAVNDFLGLHLDDVDDATRGVLFATLPVAAQLTQATRGTLALVSQTRSELQTRIDKIGGVNAATLGEIRDLQARVHSDALAVSDAREKISTFDAQFTSFQRDYSDFLTRTQKFSAEAAELGARLERFSAERNDINHTLTRLNNEVRAARSESQKAVRDVDVLKEDVRGVKVDINTIKNRRA